MQRDINFREAIQMLLTGVCREDINREGLLETPERVIRSLDFLTSGYNESPHSIFKILKTFEDGGENYNEMVYQGRIPIYSLCEHHMLPFFGFAHIGYIPSKKIVGLSKLSRLADIFARRLQVQERLTCQIADCLMEHLSPEGVGVVIQARHLCMEMRGVCKSGTETTTSALRGNFKEHSEVRAEFFSMVKMSNTCR